MEEKKHANICISIHSIVQEWKRKRKNATNQTPDEDGEALEFTHPLSLNSLSDPSPYTPHLVRWLEDGYFVHSPPPRYQCRARAMYEYIQKHRYTQIHKSCYISIRLALLEVKSLHHYHLDRRSSVDCPFSPLLRVCSLY